MPDLSGCVGMDATTEEAIENIAETIRFHLEGKNEKGIPIPPYLAEAEYLLLAIAS